MCICPGFVLSEGDKPCQSVWDLVQRHMRESLTNTQNTNDAVSLKFPMTNHEEIIAPDLLQVCSIMTTIFPRETPIFVLHF